MGQFTQYYSEFLKHHQMPEKCLHFAAHSHHFWPDVTREAQSRYWMDAATYSDDKWGHLFGKSIPRLQDYLSKIWNIPTGENIALAPNTHELVYRLLSSISVADRPIKVLTTDSEFLSFERQINRLAEENWEIEKISLSPCSSFVERFSNALKNNTYDLVFLSQVFFSTSFALTQSELESIAQLVPQETLLAIDGYHAFMAIPTSLANLYHKAFYLAGSYKYLGAGEGLCMMSIPPHCSLRPLNTGWFAELAHLDHGAQKTVYYPPNALRFAGSTMDFSALYRALAVFELWEKEKVDVPTIHQHIQKLQQSFLDQMNDQKHRAINAQNLQHSDFDHQGHFFSFDLGNQAQDWQKKFKQQGIITDVRGPYLRFGFGLYLAEDFIIKLA